MRKMTLFTLVLCVIVAIAAVFMFVKPVDNKACNPGVSLATTTITSDKALVRAEVAEFADEKVRGLSGRNCLDPDTAMLFTYDLSGDYCYWMKDMKFSIDMIWLDEDRKVVTVKDNISPSTYPQDFCPDRPARYVVEVPAGKAAQYDWRVGTQLSF